MNHFAKRRGLGRVTVDVIDAAADVCREMLQQFVDPFGSVRHPDRGRDLFGCLRLVDLFEVSH